jgi:transposase
MPKRIMIEPHLPVAELEHRYRQASDGVARSHWQIIWLLAQGASSEEVARTTGYSRPWIRTLSRRYNTQGEVGLGDHRHTNPGAASLLTPEEQGELRLALASPPPDGGLWTGPKVALWIAQRKGQAVHPQRGWEYLRRLGFRLQVPRPRHAKADHQAQEEFKKTS